jgi:hypothetical protein
MDVTDTEMRACEISYERTHGRTIAFADIPEPERDAILREIRARVLGIEQHVTHDMLVNAIAEQRRTPSRFTAPAVAAAIVMAALTLIGIGLIRLFAR